MIDHKFHQNIRANLLSSMDNNSVAIVFASPLYLRNGDVYYDHRQDSNFYYLSGFPEPKSVLLLSKTDHGQHYTLFCQSRDAQRELWDGEIIGTSRAKQLWGADDALPISQFRKKLPEMLAGVRKLYICQNQESLLQRYLRDNAEDCQTWPEQAALNFLLDEMRLIKHSAEIKWMSQAAKITQQGFEEVMKTLEPNLFEYQVEAQLVGAYRNQNATPAYPNIVAGGTRALTLHYNQNNQRLKSGDLLLIDSGAEYQCYASDVSRTLPVNGQYSEAQKTIYTIVLTAQHAAIAESVIGNSWHDVHQRAVEVLTEGLLDIGLLSGNLEQNLEQETYKTFYPHRTSHWLGMDVHDVGEYRIDKHWRDLEVGMVFTIEPGLYIPDTPEIPEAYRGIGIRIEDDILIRNKNGPLILTKDIPSTISDIENYMRHNNSFCSQQSYSNKASVA